MHSQNNRQLGRHTITYIAGSGIALLSGIILLPIYTHALSPKEYGLLETALRFVAVCMSVAFLGLRQGYLRFYFDSALDSWHKALTSTTVIGMSLVAFAIMFPIIAIAAQFSQRLGLGQFTMLQSLLLALWLAFEATYLLGLSFLQVRFKSTQFIFAQAARLTLMLGLNFTLLNVFHLGLGGALAGNFVVSLISGAVAGTLLLAWAGLKVSRPTLSGLIQFGLPYIPTAVFGYVINNADRLSLIHFNFLATLGLLSLASKLGDMALSILATPVENIWMPYAFSVLNEPTGPEKIGALFTRYVAFSILIALVVSLGASLAIDLLASDSFHDAAELVPLVAIGCVFTNVSCLADLGILVRKRTVLKPLMFGVVALIAVAMQLILTPRFGLLGAVVATTLTAICQYLIISTVAGRLYRFQVNSTRMLEIILAAGMAFLGGRWLIQTLPSIIGSLAAIAAAIAFYLAVMHFTGIATIGQLKAQLAQLLGRGRTATEPGAP
jgi:O-antigen/teichoic acid export membrane protein